MELSSGLKKTMALTLGLMIPAGGAGAAVPSTDLRKLITVNRDYIICVPGIKSSFSISRNI
jgi:hypothetical protein